MGSIKSIIDFNVTPYMLLLSFHRSEFAIVIAFGKIDLSPRDLDI